MTRRRRIWIAGTAIVVLFVLYEIVTSFVAYTSDAYVRSDLIAVAPQVTGRIVGVSVVDNQTVAAGDLLASIDPVPFQLAADQHQAEVAEANAQVSADEDTIASTQAALTAATSAATFARETQARVTALATADDASRADLQKAQNEALRANAAVQTSQAAIERAQAMASMHRAGQVRATAALVEAQWQLARTKLIAPASGTITNLTVRVGDTATQDVPLIGIVDAHAWRIIANYKQNFIRGFTVGDTAWVWLDSEPWHLHRARVDGVARGISRDPSAGVLLPYVAPTTDWIRLQRRFPVTLTLVDPPPDLKLYMGADARVLILP
ncbi:HlyD family secretion protein [Acidisphaera sp. S103]|uniref:HlyD family secretion protein n=1 Tax=Acidisphaera sp. S103 TaxID=1747223 RepID=UPI00131E8C27|nr:HlyD family secretion protein [Acidisphaera sp. S103]